MKNFSIAVIAVSSLLLSSCGTTQRVAEVSEKKKYGGVITYNLPETQIRVKVAETKTTTSPGTFVTEVLGNGKELSEVEKAFIEFIEEYTKAVLLELVPYQTPAVVTEHSVTYRVSASSLETFGVKGKRYVVRLKMQPLSEQTVNVKFNELGVPTTFTSKGENLTLDYIAATVEFGAEIGTALLTSGASGLFDGKVKGTYAEELHGRALAEADKAFDGVKLDDKEKEDKETLSERLRMTTEKLVSAIFTRDSRLETLAGAQATKTDVSIAPLDHEITKILTSLMGSKSVSLQPVETLIEYKPILSHLELEEGVCIGKLKGSKKNLYLKLTEGGKQAAFNQKEKRSKGFHYWVPKEVQAELFDDVQSGPICTERMLIGQLGDLAYLPITFGGKVSAYTVTLDPTTGALLSFNNEGSTAIRPEDTLGSIQPSLTELAKALPKAEQNALEAEASRIELENRLTKARKEQEELKAGPQ